MVHQPDPIGRATEHEASPVHIARANRQQHRFAVATTDLERDPRLRRQMNIVALHFPQSVLTDGVEKTCGRAVVE